MLKNIIRISSALSFLVLATLVPPSSAARQLLAAPTGGFCPPLPAPSGNTINVSTAGELEDAVNNLVPNTTILIADGIYHLDGVYLWIDTPDVTLRSAGGNREAVVLDGDYQTTEMITIAASNVTIADMTLRRASTHPIHVVSTGSGDTENTLIYNLHIIDPGQQAIKINPDGGGDYFPDNGTIACSHIEMTDEGRPHVSDCYTGGIDAHQAWGWTIRDNLIEGFWCPAGLSEHGIHLWRGCRDTVVERNTLNDNARGIGFGLATGGEGRTYPDDPCPSAGGSYVDHYGGVICNNAIFASRSDLFTSEYGFDCGVCLWQACNAQVVHNTVASTQAPFSSIEWRFDQTVAEIANNLVTHNLRDRGGTAYLSGNLDYQPLDLFTDGANGDLHLSPTAAAAIDQGGSLAADVCDQDMDGDPRPMGSAPDIGADEYGVQAQGAIIIDHTCTDLSLIPDYWLEAARELAVHYAHTSHGSQVLSGLERLEQRDSKYGVAIRENDTVGLPGETGVLQIYDGNNLGGGNTYITPEDYWSTTYGKNRTRSVADTGWFDYSTWTWCGQVSDADAAYINSYLSAMNTFEQEYPQMGFIYMTGHTDGSGEAGNLNVRNNQIRSYCSQNGKVLFDFADIESYDPDGNYYLDRGTNDNCDYDSDGDEIQDSNWAEEWCAAYPGDPLCDSCDCAHSQPLVCNLKARAFWWLMARLAGWDGTPGGAEERPYKSASTANPYQGETVSYTILIQGLDAPPTATIQMTDTVPDGLVYVAGSLAATAGLVDDGAAPTLTWTGALSQTPAVTVTYVTTVTASETKVVSNTAVIVAAGYETVTSTAMVIVNGYASFLPIVWKAGSQ